MIREDDSNIEVLDGYTLKGAQQREFPIVYFGATTDLLENDEESKV